MIINRPGSVTTPCCKLKQQVFLFLPLLPIRKAVLSFAFFAIRRSFACGEGALATTAAAAAAAVCYGFSLIISVSSVVVMVCLLCCLFCVILALLILVSCGAVAVPPPKRGYLHLWC